MIRCVVCYPGDAGGITIQPYDEHGQPISTHIKTGEYRYGLSVDDKSLEDAVFDLLEPAIIEKHQAVAANVQRHYEQGGQNWSGD